MKYLEVLLISLAAAVVPQPSNGLPTTPEAPGSRLMAKHLVAVADRRKMNIICLGHGKPTVVFEQGLGANILTWQKVVDQTSALTRVCFYDPAGYGYSDPPTRPSTAANHVADLHALLLRSHVPRPVVLVGHSVGGLYATLYADKYPEHVAGLLLIEPSFAGQDEDEALDERAKDEVAFRDNVSHLHSCATLARSGKLGSEKHEECFAFAPNRTAHEKAFVTYQYVRPYRYEAMASEMESQHSADGRSDVNSRTEERARRSFKDKPLMVLTAAQSIDATATDMQRASAARLWQSWNTGHEQLAARSLKGQSVVVPNTGHFIQIDQPQAVVQALKEVVRLARQVEKQSSRSAQTPH